MKQHQPIQTIATRLNKHGFTLVELLAVIVISSIFIIFCGNVIVNSMKNYDRILVETELRDEGDIIMAKLIKEFYSLQTTEIEENRACGSFPCVTQEITACKQSADDAIHKVKIGFEGQGIDTSTDSYTISNKNVLLNPDYSITERRVKNSDNSEEIIYDIYFSLMHKTKNKSISFESSVTITNTGEKGSKCIIN